MKKILTIIFSVISIIYLFPIVAVLVNSFKANSYVNTDTFALPNATSFVGFANYIKGMTFGNYPFFYSVFYSFDSVISSLE